MKDAEIPLAICLAWELETVNNYRLVLQENETGEIDVSKSQVTIYIRKQVNKNAGLLLISVIT